MGVTYKTAFRWWKTGRLDAYQLDTGTIIVRDDTPLPETATGIALYARVSTQGQKADLEGQVERLKTYAASKGYPISKVVQEIASGMNDNRPKLSKLLTDAHIGVIVVEHRDRLTRFGFAYIEQLLNMQGQRIEVMFPSDTNYDLVDDFMAVITSMASRIYGRRHSKERAEQSNIRKDALHKVTSQIVAKTKPDHERSAIIVLEDLHIAGMLKNRKLNRAVADVGMYEFKRQIEYKAAWAGVEVKQVSRWYPSSKTCSCCGWINENLELIDRVFVCLDCGYVADRDYNASKNLASQGA